MKQNIYVKQIDNLKPKLFQQQYTKPTTVNKT